MPESNKKPKTDKSPYVFWTSAEDQQAAFDKTAGNIDSYDGIMSSTASRRSYIDIEPNISVRTDFLKDDYYKFRPYEQPANNFKQAMSMSMKAYEKVGIVKICYIDAGILLSKSDMGKYHASKNELCPREKI